MVFVWTKKIQHTGECMCICMSTMYNYLNAPEHIILGQKYLPENLETILIKTCLVVSLAHKKRSLLNVKMHENWGKPIFCPMDKKMISPKIELVYLKLSWFV